ERARLPRCSRGPSDPRCDSRGRVPGTDGTGVPNMTETPVWNRGPGSARVERPRRWRIIRALTGAMARGFVRDKQALFFSLLFPVMFLVFFGVLFSDQTSSRSSLE